MDYASATKKRFKEMRPGADGKLMAEWQLTDTKLIDTVTLALPPLHAIPIIFVPGIMGSNLADRKGGPIWLLDSIRSIPVTLAWNWSQRNAGERQTILHPARTKVYRSGAVPDENTLLGLKKEDFLARGWGEVSEASYQSFLLWLDTKMNASRDPLGWSDFSPVDGVVSHHPLTRQRQALQPGKKMTMRGMPEIAESVHKVEPITSDDLLKRSKSIYPVYAFGYNWLDTNAVAADDLQIRIKNIIAENKKGPINCTQVILVTHSMGGLVARACSQLEGMERRIVGIVHGVMPATGAAVAYRRCKVGMKDEDPRAGLVIGSDGREVTAVFAQSPGALQLLPSENYGANWLQLADPSGRVISTFPKADPYEEIYLQRGRWWSLIREEWLSPIAGKPIKWTEFEKNIVGARAFHRSIAGKYHPNTFTFYGGGREIRSFEKITWAMKKGFAPDGGGIAPLTSDVTNFGQEAVRTDGSNNVYIGGRSLLSTSSRGDSLSAHYSEQSFWEVRCAAWNSVGDGTVPTLSGRAPRLAGGKNILQQFELPGVEHEPAFRDSSTAQLVTYYAITKLAALADRE